MKLSVIPVVILSCLSVVAYAETSAVATPKEQQAIAKPSKTVKNSKFKSEADRLSYTIGVDLGKNFKKQEVNINSKILLQGLRDAAADKKLQMSDEEMRDTLKSFRKEQMAKRVAKFKVAAEENTQKGQAFLEKNKKKEGVVTLPSGLQYKVIIPGKGAKPSAQDTVTVEYTGTLIDGKVFDSTDNAGQPATFRVGQVIPGWQEALQLMKSGATWQLYIPAKLAYGERGAGGAIGPNETLIFKVNLLSIEKAKKGDKKPS